MKQEHTYHISQFKISQGYLFVLGFHIYIYIANKQIQYGIV